VRARAIVGVGVLALALAACGGDGEEGSGPTPAPASSSFPDPAGRTIDELLAEAKPGDDIVASPAGAVFEPGDKRFAFGLFHLDRSQVTDAEVAIYAQSRHDSEARGPFPARVESLETEPAYVAKTTADDPDAAKVVYVSKVPFKTAGEWRLIAMVRTDDGVVAARVPSVVVKEQKGIPGVGEPAPVVHTPTADDVGSLAEIDTRQPPSTMHEHDLADVLGEQPVVLLFATPALCVSRVCGPVVDVAEQVKDDYADEGVAFIHMEIYEDNVMDPENLRPQVKAYGLFTEPWLFVIDAQGIVRERIEGAFSVSELEKAVERVLADAPAG
jgi:hypothetical protein